MKNFKQFLLEQQNKYNNMIDFTLLDPNSKIEDIKAFCQTAIDNNYYCIVVLPENVNTAKIFIEDTNIKLSTVISFPKGNDKTIDKIKEAQQAIAEGVNEIDLVMDYNKLKKLDQYSDKYDDIYKDIYDDVRQVTELCHKNGVVIKVIIESGVLTFDQVKTACNIVEQSAADYIMTSTGSAKMGAELDKVKFMRKILPEYIKIKVSGGIRDIDTLNKFVGYADRIGTSTMI